MTIWKNIEADIKPSAIAVIFEKLGFLDVIQIIASSIEVPFIISTQSVMTNLYNHVSSSKWEIGGLLIGKSLSLPYRTKHGYDFVTFITDSIPTASFRSSAASLTMDTEIWHQSKDCLDNDKMVVGWYHSHPNLGAFFSGTDQYTQRSFFNNPYSLGVVIDPYRNHIRCFSGADSIEIPFNCKIVSDELLASLLIVK